MNQRAVVALSAVALVAVVAGGAALALHTGGGSEAPAPIIVQSEEPSSPEANSTSTAVAQAPLAAGPFNPNFTFVLDGELPALDGDRPAWHLPANPTADPDAITTLARALGVDGDVKVVDGGWQVGDPTSGPNLFVNKSSGLPWYFSNISTPNDAQVCPAGTTVPPGADVSTTIFLPECAPPPPPVGVPTKDEAVAKAGDLFKALGIDSSSFALTAFDSEWSADVQAIPTFDGIRAQGLMWFVSFGGEGKLQSANGFLLTPERGDSYPRIGARKAFELLKAGIGARGYGYGFIASATTAAVPADDAASSEGGSTTTACMIMGTVPNNATVSCPLVPCGDPPPPTTTIPVDEGMSPSAITCGSIVCGFAPVTTIPGTAPAGVTTEPPAPPCADPTPPEPVTITIIGVHETFLTFMGADGSTWLVPGYEFVSSDGGAWPVLALDESLVQQFAPAPPILETSVAAASSSAPPTTAAGG